MNGLWRPGIGTNPCVIMHIRCGDAMEYSERVWDSAAPATVLVASLSLSLSLWLWLWLRLSLSLWLWQRVVP